MSKEELYELRKKTDYLLEYINWLSYQNSCSNQRLNSSELILALFAKRTEKIENYLNFQIQNVHPNQQKMLESSNTSLSIPSIDPQGITGYGTFTIFP